MRTRSSGRPIGGSRRLRVVLIDDDCALLHSWRGLILAAGLNCAGAFSDPERALAHIPDIEPGVALVDEEMPKPPGISFVRLLRSKIPDLRIIMVSERANGIAVERAFAAGAVGYLVKGECQKQAIADAIRAAAGGTIVLSPSAQSALAQCGAPSVRDDWTTLTPQQQRIVQFLRLGHSDKMIAAEVGLAVSTVRGHLEAIYRRIGVSSRLELFAKIVRGSAERTQ